MAPTLETWMFLTGIIVQAVGIASMAAARLSTAGKRQQICQRLFLGSLCSVGALALLGLGIAGGMWLSSSAIFSVMVLGAVMDFGSVASSVTG